MTYNQQPTINNLRVVFLLPLLLLLHTAFAQEEKKEVEIINADLLKYQEVGGRKLTKLIGAVQLRQEQMTLWCDSALLDKEQNNMEAWGDVHMQNDTVNAYGNHLTYDGVTKIAVLQGRDAILTDSRMKLYSREIFYHTKDKAAYYYNGGRVLKDSTVITSVFGSYFANEDEVFFNKEVRITDPNYRLNSDTLKYNVSSKRATFFGNTEIFNDNSTITCNNGWYDSDRDIASFGKGTVVNNPPQVLYADSLYYMRETGFGRAFHHFQFVDSTMDMEMFGSYGEYIDERSYIMATQQAFMIYKMEKDSLFLAADTLKSQQHSATDTTKEFFGYRHARMYMRDMQGLCDSLFYSFRDSTFRMYRSPVLWADSVQMTGDTIHLTVKNKQADKLSIYKNGFIISPSGKRFFDQVKGTDIFGWFKENELEKMLVEGNAESLYYGKDERNKYMGANYATCARMWLYFKNKKIGSIHFISKPEAVFTPMRQLPADKQKLKDFNWQEERRPKSREELMR